MLASLLQATGDGPNTVTDAHIGALAMEHDAVVHSNDRIFARFPGVQRHNPIT